MQPVPADPAGRRVLVTASTSREGPLMTTVTRSDDRPARSVRPSRATAVVTTAGAALLVLAGCGSTVQGAVAGNTRLNTATTQASLPLNSTSVLTPQTSPQQPSNRATPGATEYAGPSPDADQTTALRERLRSIDPAFDTDDAVSKATAVCGVVVDDAATSLDIANEVRSQFGSDLSGGTVTAIQNVITNTFCQT